MLLGGKNLDPPRLHKAPRLRGARRTRLFWKSWVADLRAVHLDRCYVAIRENWALSTARRISSPLFPSTNQPLFFQLQRLAIFRTRDP